MGEVLVTEPDSYVSALLLLFAIAPCWSLERSVWSHPEQTKTESNVSVFWWPEESDDVTSHAVLSSTSPSVVTLTGFTLSTTVLNWQKESQWGKWRRGRFTFVLYHIWDKSDLLENSRRADFYWRSWNCLQVSDDPGVHTGGRYSGVGFILESSLVILETPSVTFMFNTLLQPIRSLSRLHKPELKKLRTTNHNHTCFFQGFWKITSHVTLTRSGLLLDGWTLCLVLWRSVCVTAGSLFGFYGLFNTACACRGKINEMMNKEKGNENFVLSLSSVCHTRLYEQLSLSLRKQHRWYIFMYKACWVIALIIFIAYEQLLGLSLVFLVPGVKTESSNERKLLLSSWETWNLRSSTAECVCDPDQVSVEPDFTLLVKYKKQSSWLEPRFRLWLGVNISMVTAVVFPTNSTLLLFTDADIFQFSIQSMLFKTTAASRRFIL